MNVFFICFPEASDQTADKPEKEKDHTGHQCPEKIGIYIAQFSGIQGIKVNNVIFSFFNPHLRHGLCIVPLHLRIHLCPGTHHPDRCRRCRDPAFVIQEIPGLIHLFVEHVLFALFHIDAVKIPGGRLRPVLVGRLKCYVTVAVGGCGAAAGIPNRCCRMFYIVCQKILGIQYHCFSFIGLWIGCNIHAFQTSGQLKDCSFCGCQDDDHADQRKHHPPNVRVSCPFPQCFKHFFLLRFIYSNLFRFSSVYPTARSLFSF